MRVLKSMLMTSISVSVSMASAATPKMAAFIASEGQARVIKTQVVRHGSCQYLAFEKCSLADGQLYSKQTNLSKIGMSCSPLFKNIEGISEAVLPEIARDEQNKAYAKTAAGVVGGVVSLSAVVVALPVAGGGVVAGGGLLSTSVVGGSGSAAAGIAGVVVPVAGVSTLAVPAVTFTSGITEKVLPMMRFINPFFNGAVVKMLNAQEGKTTAMLDTNGLIEQAPAILSSFGDLTALKDTQTGCDAALAKGELNSSI